MSAVNNLVAVEEEINGSTDNNEPVADVDAMLLSETISFLLLLLPHFYHMTSRLGVK